MLEQQFIEKNKEREFSDKGAVFYLPIKPTKMDYAACKIVEAFYKARNLRLLTLNVSDVQSAEFYPHGDLGQRIRTFTNMTNYLSCLMTSSSNITACFDA